MGKMVFFDLLGLSMVYYPQRIGEIINVLVVISVLLILYRKIKAFKRSGTIFIVMFLLFVYLDTLFKWVFVKLVNNTL